MTKQILIVEDDGVLANLLKKNLSRKGYTITVKPYAQVVPHVQAHRPDLVLVEVPSTPAVNLPDFCRLLRQSVTAPMIIVTDAPFSTDELEGAELLTRPIDFRELTETIDQALNQQKKRRRKPPRFLRLGDLVLDLEEQRLSKHDRDYHLRPREFLLLKLFMSNPGQVLTHRAIMKEVWNTDYVGDTRTLYVHVSWIREKVEDNPRAPVRLRTVRGVGYRFDVQPA